MTSQRRWYHDDTLYAWLIASVVWYVLSLAIDRPPRQTDLRVVPYDHSIIAPNEVCPYPPPESSGVFH